MHPFALSRADDAAQAIAAHSQDPHLAFIAGGTDLIGLIKDRATLPERLLDINHLPGLARIEARPDGGLHIGALAHMSDVAAHIEVRRRFPVIAEALLFAASGQLRNMATIGGNIMQRTRCAYFRDEDDVPCNKRRHEVRLLRAARPQPQSCVFGWSDACVATHPSTWRWRLPPWMRSSSFAGRQDNDQSTSPTFIACPAGAERDNVLERGDLIVAIEVPARPEGRASLPQGSGSSSYEFALVSVAAGVATDNGRIQSARLALGGCAQAVAPPAAEAALRVPR
jgi:xanthine dehydrogenase YagS FAD-binding subunit